MARGWHFLATVIAVGLLAAACGPAQRTYQPPRATPELQGVNLDSATQTAMARAQRVVFLIPFSHWDTDWHDTFDHYAAHADQNIAAAIAIAQQDRRFRYTLEQVLFVQHFWITHPEDHDVLVNLVRRGQFTFAWGGITQPETSLVAPEVQVRNLQLGDDWIASTFGVAPPHTAWQSDAFGTSAAFPIFLNAVGVDGVFLGRVTNICPQRPCANPLPHAFYWASPADPTQRVLATYLTYSAPWQAIAGKDTAGQLAGLQKVIAGEEQRTSSKYLFLPLGDDFSDPLPTLPALVDHWNAADPGTLLVMADPATAFRYLATQPLPTVTADRNPAWQAFYGTRPEAKVADKDSAYLLTAADAFSLLDAPRDVDESAAWHDAAINAHYDNISGVGFDSVWQASQQPRFTRAVSGAATELAKTLARIAAATDAPLVLFNSAPQSRAEVVELHGNLPDAVLQALPPPVQRLDPTTVAFWSGNVPALGYAAPATGPPAASPQPATVTQNGQAVTLANGLVSVTLDGAHGGAFSSLRQTAGPELLRGYGDDLAYYDDSGDIYGAQFGGVRARESATPATVAVLASGPLVARVQVTVSLGGQTVVKTVTVTAGSPRVDVTVAVAALPQTSVIVQVPLALAATARTDDLGFTSLTHQVDDQPITPGTSTYRREVFYPFEAWSDVSAGGAGLTLMTHGLQGLGGMTTLNLLLVRDVNDGGRPDSEGVTDRAVHLLCYAYLPHSGDARTAQPAQAADAFNRPLIPVWGTGATRDVQFPPLAGVTDTPAPMLVNVPAAPPRRPMSFSLLTGDVSGRVADLYERAGRTEMLTLPATVGKPPPPLVRVVPNGGTAGAVAPPMPPCLLAWPCRQRVTRPAT